MGCKVGSICTSLHTSVSKEAVKSRISLCLMVGKPPLGQGKAYSIENLMPQGQLLGSQIGSQLYRSAITSRKAVLWSENPCSCTDSTVNQLEAPFSEANSKAFFEHGDDCFTRASLVEMITLDFEHLPADLGNIWVLWTSLEYRSDWDKSRDCQGPVTLVEASYSIDDNWTGVTIPKPPGRASKLLSNSPGDDHPITAGIKNAMDTGF